MKCETEVRLTFLLLCKSMCYGLGHLEVFLPFKQYLFSLSDPLFNFLKCPCQGTTGREGGESAKKPHGQIRRAGGKGGGGIKRNFTSKS